MRNKETLEEVAERLYPDKHIGFASHFHTKERNAFIEGAKWQQEQLYSEEEVINLLKALQLYKLVHTERIDIEKWLEKFKNNRLETDDDIVKIIKLN